MTEGGSGLSMKDLYLKDRAAHRVAAEYRKMLPQLEKLRDQAMGADTDLGMGACREGQTWNAALTDVVKGGSGSIVAAIDGVIAEAKAVAEWAEKVQYDFEHADERGAESLAKLSSDGAYPPISGD